MPTVVYSYINLNLISDHYYVKGFLSEIPFLAINLIITIGFIAKE